MDSPINKYYVQTLCMIFFPGEKFGENEEESEDGPALVLRTEEREGEIVAYAEVSLGDKCCRAERSSPLCDYRTRERTLKLAVGAAVLAAAGELIGYRPSWGMLIGVRPSKVATELLNTGISKTRVKKVLTSDFLVTPKKAALAIAAKIKNRKKTTSLNRIKNAPNFGSIFLGVVS